MLDIFRKWSLLFTPVLRVMLTFLLVLPLSAQHSMTGMQSETSKGTTATKQAQAAKRPGPKQDPGLVGSWSAPVDIGVIGIHAALLHTGKVLVWYYPEVDGGNSRSKLYDTATGTVKDVTFPFPGDFFCSGQTILADGRVLVTGGLNGIPGPLSGDWGITLTAIFDPATETWSPAMSMNLARWYPTDVEMANGQILTLSGKDENGHNQVKLEVYDPATGLWTLLPASANIASNLDTYPKMRLLPSGKLYMAGPDAETQLFSPGLNRWTPSATMQFGDRYHGAAVLLPGTAAKPLAQVFAAGGSQVHGGGNPTATAEMIDMTVADPQWAFVNSMNIPRYNANMVLLADGTILMVGGAQIAKYTNPVQIPELYDLNTGVWTEMATQTAPRPYHSTALLLPDGTVFSAGSDDPKNTPTDSTYEIFSPPYLFKGARPVISSAPTALTYNSSFTITTPDAGSIQTVALVRPSATTHDNDMDQRYVPLKFARRGGQLRAKSPRNANYAPPGWYMLLIVNTSGVPSVMPFLQLE